jgi:amidase
MGQRQELMDLDGIGQAALIRRGEVTPLELVEASIAQIEAVNPQINAIVRPMFEEARSAAQGPLPSGPLAGVPFVLKDLQAAYAGVEMTSGSIFLRNFRPSSDAELVSRYRRAGLLIVGKSNTPEFGILPTTEPTLFGGTRNPWERSRTAGGSSGGTAAAVATRMVALGHANDGGGSIRIPASCCGLFGLKPTRARNPLGPHFGDLFSGLVVEHGLTRSVRDSAALLDTTAGPAPGDPYWAPTPVRPFLEEVGANPGNLRIAFSKTASTGVPVDPECQSAVVAAARLCEMLGHKVEEAAPNLPGELLTQAFMTLWAAGVAWTVDSLSRAVGRHPTPGELEPGTEILVQMGRQIDAPTYLMAVQTLQSLSRTVATFMADYDLLLTPTLAAPPLPLGSFTATTDDPLAGLRRAGLFVPFTPLANATGQPAMSVPLHWTNQGLPIGVHFTARFGEEATLFRLAAQLESASPWQHLCPALSSEP